MNESVDIKLVTDKLIERIRRLLIAKKFDAAIQLIDQALKADALSPDLYNLKGQALLHSGKLEEAMKIFTVITKQWPNNIEALNGQALCLIYKRDWDTGIQLLLSVLEKDPTNSDAKENLNFIKREITLHDAIKFMQDGDYEAAKNLLEEILRQDENHIAALNNLADIHIREYNFDKASLCLSSIVRCNPVNEEVLNKINSLQKHAADYHIRNAKKKRHKMQKLLVSVHIPKCGGSSFYKLLKAHYGDSLYADYGLEWAIKNESLLSITQNTRCLHGHFRANKYDEIFPASSLVTWVRNPVMRIISHYHFVLRFPPSVYWNPTPACKLVHERNLSLVEFAQIPGMQNVLTRYFAGKKLDDFNFIGVVEFYKESLEQFCKMADIPIPEVVPHENVNKNLSDGYNTDKEVIDQISKLNAPDCELYQRVIDTFCVHSS